MIRVHDALHTLGVDPDGTVTIAGSSYYYQGGTCDLFLWEPEGRQPAFSVVWTNTVCASQPEEVGKVLNSMVRVEGTGGENW